MTNYRMVSADSHVLEPPKLWEERIDPSFADRGPRLVSEEKADWWYVDGKRLISVAAGAQAGIKYRPGESDWRFQTYEARWENVIPGAYIPTEHVKDLDTDGITAAVLYPTIGLRHFYLVEDTALFRAICKAYNTWVSEFCSEFPDRLLGVAMIDLEDVAAGVQELLRAADLGLRGAMITVSPPEDRAYDNPMYEPLWQAAEECRMPLSLHLATERPPNSLQQLQGWGPMSMATRPHWTEMSVGRMIFSGVFTRHPDLKLAIVEQDAAWGPFFIESMDRVYQHKQWQAGWPRFADGVLPSDYFHRSVGIAFQDDRLGVELRSHIGVENLMWGSDYPHPDGTFPHTQEILHKMFHDIPAEDMKKIVGENASRFYGIS